MNECVTACMHDCMYECRDYLDAQVTHGHTHTFEHLITRLVAPQVPMECLVQPLAIPWPAYKKHHGPARVEQKLQKGQQKEVEVVPCPPPVGSLVVEIFFLLTSKGLTRHLS